MLGAIARQSLRCGRVVSSAQAHRVAPAAARLFSSEPSTEVDVKLQQGFDSAWNRMKETWSLLGKNERDAFHKALNEGVLRPNMLEAILCYVDLKNPLLQKYNFDYKEFFTGAQHACVVLDQAMFSQEFRDYCNGSVTESEDAAFLQSLLHPNLFREVQKAAVIYPLLDEQLQAERDVAQISLTRIATRVVQPGAMSPHVSPTLAKEDAQTLPAGAVMASVFVNVDMEWKNAETQNTWVRHQELVFDGCISGHVPCEWVVRQLVSTIPRPKLTLG